MVHRSSAECCTHLKTVGYEYTLVATVVMGALAIGLLAWYIKFPAIDKDQGSADDQRPQKLENLRHQPAEA